MSIFNEFPYINFHEMNLDWIIARVKEWLTTAENWETWKNDTDQALKDLKAYVDNYFDNLDLQTEINNKLDAMVANGTLAAIINQQIFGELNEKVEELEYFQRIYTNWEGWSVYITKDGYLSAGMSKEFTVTENHHYDNALPNAFSEVMKVALPTPVEGFGITATCDTDGCWVSDLNIADRSRLNFRIWFPYNFTAPKTVHVRFTLTSKIRQAPLNPTKAFNAVNAAQLVNIAKTYVDAQIGGRAFGYGRNFFYESAPHVINNNNGAGMLECDTFVGLCLRGIPYAKSPYMNLTPSFTYDYNDLYKDISSAAAWQANTQYSIGDIVTVSDQISTYWECTSDHTSGATFNPSYWKSVWVINPDNIGWSTTLNNLMHPANPYIRRDIRFAPDYAFMAWSVAGSVFSNTEEVKTGDIAIWVRRIHTMTSFGGYSQSPGFDNVGHIGIISIEDGVKYLYHVSTANATEGRIVEKRRLDVMNEQPTYYARLV